MEGENFSSRLCYSKNKPPIDDNDTETDTALYI